MAGRGGIFGAFERAIALERELIENLKQSPLGERLALAESGWRKILSGFGLEAVLEILPDEDCLAFAELARGKIQDGDQLIYVLKKIPEVDRLTFIKPACQQIQRMYLLVAVLNLLRTIDYQEFLNLDAIKNQLQNFDQLLFLLKERKLCNRARLGVAKVLRDRIRDDYQLEKVLAELPKGADSTEFALSEVNRIRSGYQLGHCLRRLSEDGKQSLAISAHRSIRDFGELRFVLNLLSDVACLALVSLEAVQNKIENDEQLAFVLTKLPEADHETFDASIRARWEVRRQRRAAEQFKPTLLGSGALFVGGFRVPRREESESSEEQKLQDVAEWLKGIDPSAGAAGEMPQEESDEEADGAEAEAAISPAGR